MRDRHPYLESPCRESPLWSSRTLDFVLIMEKAESSGAKGVTPQNEGR
jgi:hypothetical protein